MSDSLATMLKKAIDDGRVRCTGSRSAIVSSVGHGPARTSADGTRTESTLAPRAENHHRVELTIDGVLTCTVVIIQQIHRGMLLHGGAVSLLEFDRFSFVVRNVPLETQVQKLASMFEQDEIARLSRLLGDGHV